MNVFAGVTMGDTVVEKTAEELRREINELRRQQREVLSSSPIQSPFLVISLRVNEILYRN